MLYLSLSLAFIPLIALVIVIIFLDENHIDVHKENIKKVINGIDNRSHRMIKKTKDTLFYTFKNLEERHEFGGTTFIELQCCRLNKDVKLNDIVSLKKIKYGFDDSLFVFVDDIDDFYESYGKIFNNGAYNKNSVGPMDIYGINYYDSVKVKNYIEYIDKEKPKDYQVLLDWLDKALELNGFYILGI